MAGYTPHVNSYILWLHAEEHEFIKYYINEHHNTDYITIMCTMNF